MTGVTVSGVGMTEFRAVEASIIELAATAAGRALADGDVSVGDRLAFAGADRLRDGRDATDSRLTKIADEE